MKQVYDMAIVYYPKYWGIKRIEALYDLGKLTDKEYKEIISKENDYGLFVL